MSWIRHHVVLLLLGLVILGASSLRLWKIGTIPYGYAYDEVGIIYDAWSVSLWHRDQFAHFMPLSFQSFGDYKPPFLIYLLAVIYTVIGLKEEAIRYISALAGIGSVIIIYYFAKIVFVDKKLSAWIGLLAALVVAISPWSIHLSRVGFEQNATFFLGLTGLWLLYKGLFQPRYLWISSPFLVASCYAFHTAKIFIPLVVAWTWFWFSKKTARRVSSWVGPLLLTIVLLLPLGYSSLFQQGNERSKTLILFTEAGTPAGFGGVLMAFGKNCLYQLSPSFWMNGWDGISIRHAVMGYGVLLWPVYGMFLFSIVWLVCKKREPTTWWLLGMVGIGLLPALLSRQTPHVLRSQFALIPVAMITAIGVVSALAANKHKRLFVGGLLGITGIVLWGYVHAYFGPYATQSASAFQYGYREAIGYIQSIKRDSDHILVTRAYEQPYIYLLLYNRITPQAFLFGGLNQYQIQDIVWPDSRPHTIFLATPKEIHPSDPKVVKVISIPITNEPVLVVAQNE